MFIEKILARLKIQTKVIILVLPFVASICAVGLTGLYASSLLQTRMEISNSVLQSLSGFKGVYGVMNQFLEDTSEQSRDSVYATIAKQKDILIATMNGLAPDSDRSKLEDAQNRTSEIEKRMDGLWSLYVSEVKLREAMSQVLGVLSNEQATILGEATKLQRSARQSENAAKRVLRDADRLAKGSKVFAELAATYAQANSLDAKLKFVQEQSPLVAKTQQSIFAVISQEAVAEKVGSMLAELDKLVESSNPADVKVANIDLHVAGLASIGVQLQAAASEKMLEATRLLSELDKPLVQSDTILVATRKLVNSIYSLRIAAAAFLGQTSDANREVLLDELRLVKGDISALRGSARGMPFVDGVEATLMPPLKRMQQSSAELVKISATRMEEFRAAGASIDGVWNLLSEFAEEQKSSAGLEREKANTVSVSATVAGIVIAILAGVALVFTLKGPIGQITGAMRRLADGYLDTRISGESRADEIGDMARALGVFKENALSKIRIEAESDKQRAASEAERTRNDLEKQALDAQIEFAVNALAAGLGRLARGDLSRQIETPFTGRLEQLRQNFNISLNRLQDTLRQIRTNAVSIQRSGSELLQSADTLAKRTESQAASLEETAAAVEQITSTVRSSAERAHEASLVVGETKRSADNSASVVNSAIAAMDRIEAASRQIEQIVDVIEDIAFQTNLLALNAGIEAARAGDAGKGFAVVAQEVRELAQRSASSAHEIKGLIDKSTSEVCAGSILVQETGSVLASIGNQIVTVNRHVHIMATASRDQATALHEVNGSVNQMDQMTQLNASMVDLTASASRKLAAEADTLVTLVEQFRLESSDRQAVVADCAA